MTEAWYEGLPDDAFETETDKAYEKATAKIREGLAQGLDFDSACAQIDVQDNDIRQNIIEDMLKVLIAEEHFTRNITLDDLSKKLSVSVERLESAKKSMLEDVKNDSIKALYKGQDSGGPEPHA
jgi:YesN/AraC family two-component response regulator